MRASAPALPATRGRPRARDVAWLFLAVFAAYATAIPGDFVWLDHVEIEQGGYRIVAGSDWLRVWMLSLDQYLDRNSGLTEVGGGYWRPVYAISLSLDWCDDGFFHQIRRNLKNEEIKSWGVDALLMKPFRLLDLSKVTRDVLSRETV